MSESWKRAENDRLKILDQNETAEEILAESPDLKLASGAREAAGEVGIEMQEATKKFETDTWKALKEFDDKIAKARIMGNLAGGHPSEMNSGLETAERVHAEILERLEQLKGLKFAAQE